MDKRWSQLTIRRLLILMFFFSLACTWRHSSHVGDQKQKHFSYWQQNYVFKKIFEKKIIVLTTKMAALLRACEPRIHNTVEPGYNEDPVITRNIWRNYSKI